MEEINNFLQAPDENLYQSWGRFKELLMKCPQHYLTEIQDVILFYNGLGIPTRQIFDSRGAIPSKTIADAKMRTMQRTHYTKDFPIKEEGKTLEEAYYTQFGGPFQGGRYRAAAPGFYQRNNVNPSYQERRQSMEDTLSMFMSESEKRHKENSYLIKEIRASTHAAIQNQGASIKTLEIQIGQTHRTEPYTNVRDKTNKDSIFKSFEWLLLPFLSAARTKIDVYKIKITLRVGEEKIIFTSIKHASSLIKRVYMLSLRERMELDLEARLMGETLVINRSLDPYFEDYIELNDLNEAFKLRRNQGDDLMPTIKEGEVIEEFRTKDDELDTEIDDYLRMGDVIFGKPLLKEVRIKTRRFKGMITIYNGDDEVTYQMVRSHPRFKHYTNEQCNKIPPLLKMRRWKNGSHASTLACMRWNGEVKAEEKSNLKTSL
ncbi:hypothetical protein Tco_0854974 [Tanacetum coccineum]